MPKPKNAADDKSKYARMERAVVNEVSEFLFALGNSFTTARNADAAFDCFKYCTDLNPKRVEAVYNIAVLYNLTGNLEGAYRMFKEALRMQPGNSMTQTALSEVARKLGKLDEAQRLLVDALKTDPDNYIVHSGMAILLYDMGRLSEAMEFNEKALSKKPSDVHMLLNRSLINMTYGQWAENWQWYEFCLTYQKNEKMRNLRMSDAWSGQACEGQTLFVISDQGSGDAIQFSRYLAEAKALGKFSKLVYYVQPDLKELLARVEGVDEVVGFGETLAPKYDQFSSLLGIMRILQISPENCNRPPHIITDRKLDEVWKHRVDSRWDQHSLKIGMVWAGDPRHGNDHARSLPLSQFLKIIHGSGDVAPVSGVQLFSLQVGPGMKQLSTAPIDPEVDVVELGSDFRNFDDTASAIEQLDMVITCDTSVAHLAGSMGKVVWVLIANPPEWRWLLDVGTTNWYSNVKLFRQTQSKDWDRVMDAVLNELHRLVQDTTHDEAR